MFYFKTDLGQNNHQDKKNKYFPVSHAVYMNLYS